MKRIFILGLLMAFLTGCGAENSPQKTEPAALSPTTTTSAVEPATSSVAAAPGPAPPASSLEVKGENPDFKEDPKVYEKDSSKIVDATVTLFEKPGASLKDLNNDTDPFDDYEPKVEVLFQEGDFGTGLHAPNGTMKVRGNSTRDTDQKSFKISLMDKTKTWRDQSSIILNKHPYDLSRVRNKLSFDLFKGMPHLGSLRTLFIRLMVKKDEKDPGKDFGLFSHVESSNRNTLVNHGLDPEANMYFAENFTFQRYPDVLRLETDSDFDKKRFEKVLGIAGNSDHAKILAMLDDVNNETLDIDLVIKKHFNLNNYLTWFAMNILVENLDTISQNFSLYSPKSGRGWYFLPWDYDGAWGFSTQPSQKRAEYLRLRWTQGVSNWWEVKLHSRFLKKPENLKALQTRMEELMKNELSAEKIKGLLKNYHDGVKACLSRRPDVDFLPVTHAPDVSATPEDALAQFETEYNRLPSIIEQSYKTFIISLDRPMPFNLGSIQAEKDQTAFYWDKAYSLRGEQITYDFLLSKTPVFEKSDLIFELLDLPDSKLVSDSPAIAKLSLPSAKLPTGTIFWKVLARSVKNPQDNWQTAFEFLQDNAKSFDGVRSFVKP